GHRIGKAAFAPPRSPPGRKRLYHRRLQKKQRKFSRQKRHLEPHPRRPGRRVHRPSNLRRPTDRRWAKTRPPTRRGASRRGRQRRHRSRLRDLSAETLGSFGLKPVSLFLSLEYLSLTDTLSPHSISALPDAVECVANIFPCCGIDFSC